MRSVWKVPGKTRGRCMECSWTPVGETHTNVGREAMRHTRKTGHTTRFACTEIVEYRTPALVPSEQQPA